MPWRIISSCLCMLALLSLLVHASCAKRNELGIDKGSTFDFYQTHWFKFDGKYPDPSEWPAWLKLPRNSYFIQMGSTSIQPTAEMLRKMSRSRPVFWWADGIIETNKTEIEHYFRRELPVSYRLIKSETKVDAQNFSYQSMLPNEPRISIGILSGPKIYDGRFIAFDVEVEH